ncbi:hypothetical protein SDC9_82705 [bioreactor metagenome]|uniref:Uncharacterized protein n=1 Tax=bioreactor metagenome TaxID=1076179 RepID=A0A644Z5M1_9ZZZZ
MRLLHILDCGGRQPILKIFQRIAGIDRGRDRTGRARRQKLSGKPNVRLLRTERYMGTAHRDQAGRVKAFANAHLNPHGHGLPAALCAIQNFPLFNGQFHYFSTSRFPASVS